MHDAEARLGGALAAGDGFGDEVLERRRQGLALRRPLALAAVADGVDAGGLLDDDEVPVEVTEADLFGLFRGEAGGGRAIRRRRLP
jgi:hypothetical protein